jgi:hypothetical protein
MIQGLRSSPSAKLLFARGHRNGHGHAMENTMKNPFASLATIGRSHATVHKNPFRIARFQRFLSMVDAVIAERGSCRVIDVGGTNDYWLANEDMWGERPMHVTVMNLGADATSHPKLTPVTGNACDMREFADMSFDLAHSNSVIEHVGRWRDQKAMASEVARVARRYYVQTPYVWFPIEPHYRAPLIHWLPIQLRAAALRRKSIGFYPKAETMDESMASAEDASMLDFKQMVALFPDASVEREKFGFLTKSLIAIR